MHDFYSQEVKEELVETTKEIEEIEVILDKLKNYFNTWELSREHNYTMAQLTNGEVKPVEVPLNTSQKYFNVQINNYNKLFTIVQQKKEKKKELKVVDLPCNIFCYILIEFNKRLIRKMIYEQYRFSNLFIGDLLVVPYEHKEGKLAVNWPKSKENKEAILKRGEIPYLLADEKKAKKEGVEYNGVKWLEHFEPLTLLFGWEKSFKNFVRLAESKNFIFRASRGQKKNAPVKQLALYKNTLTKEDYKTLYNFEPK